MIKLGQYSSFLVKLELKSMMDIFGQQKKTKLPISSKEWREKVEDESFKSWLSNRERLKDKRKEYIDQ